MKLWYKFSERTPEHYKELVIRSKSCCVYKYESAMAINKYNPYTREYTTLVEHKLDYIDGAYKSYCSSEMCESFNPEEKPEIEWCYLEALCRLTE